MGHLHKCCFRPLINIFRFFARDNSLRRERVGGKREKCGQGGVVGSGRVFEGEDRTVHGLVTQPSHTHLDVMLRLEMLT